MTRQSLIRESRSLARYFCARYAFRHLTGDSDLVAHLADDAIDLWHEVAAWAGPDAGVWQ
jgi:hypothetical protein